MALRPHISKQIQRYIRHTERMKNILFLLLILILSITACIGYNAFIITKNSIYTGSANSQEATSAPNNLNQGQPTPQSLTLTETTMFHHDLARTSYEPNAPDPQQFSSAWQKSLDGSVYAEPLVIGGDVIVATENDSIYSLDATTGKVQWQQHVGTPIPQKDLPCGDVFPLGITGTPVYDPATKLVFAVAEITGPKHILVGLNVQTGAIKIQQNADLPDMDPIAYQQRAALALENNMVYIAYGGLSGDCSDYIGTVIGIPTNGQGQVISYRIPTKREGGIWATPGPVIDANGDLFIAVGNGDATNGAWDHSDSVLRLSPTLQLEDGFAPTDWANQNAEDADLGSMGPVLLPNNQIFVDGKAGKGYLLDGNKLGGIGGQLQEQDLCTAFGASATMGSVIFVPCTNGVLQLTITGSTMQRGWQANGKIHGSPIIGGHTVYSLGGATLYALDSQTGKVQAQVDVGDTSRFATPTLSGNFVFVGTMAGISAVTLS
jgi:outer membrane protein assembly factor BamB